MPRTPPTTNARLHSNERAVTTSVIRRVSAERLVVLGWGRAILMQLAHPLVAAGVAGHSAFRGSVSEGAARLYHTVSAMLSLTFGDAIRREAALERIRAIHRTVHGTLAEAVGPFPAGTPYSAEDPALLLWVHATLLDSNAEIYQRLVAPLSTGELDALCDQSASLLVELGGDADTAPRTWRALRTYMDHVQQSGILAVIPAAREIGAGVLAPRAGGWPAPLSGLHRLIEVGLLPPAIRDAYGFEWNALREARFQRAMRIIRATRRLLPPALAYWRDARRSTARAASSDGDDA
jgi:uncharacterized protein (DUF2236 family)